MTTINRLKANLRDSINAKANLLENKVVLEKFSVAVDVVINRYRLGGRIYIAGNGGSAADAQHLAAEAERRRQIGTNGGGSQPPLAIAHPIP